jgi:hypothetical protein
MARHPGVQARSPNAPRGRQHSKPSEGPTADTAGTSTLEPVQPLIGGGHSRGTVTLWAYHRSVCVVSHVAVFTGTSAKRPAVSPHTQPTLQTLVFRLTDRIQTSQVTNKWRMGANKPFKMPRV